jgi:hypothetical protein
MPIKIKFRVYLSMLSAAQNTQHDTIRRKIYYETEKDMHRSVHGKIVGAMKHHTKTSVSTSTAPALA